MVQSFQGRFTWVAFYFVLSMAMLTMVHRSSTVVTATNPSNEVSTLLSIWFEPSLHHRTEAAKAAADYWLWLKLSVLSTDSGRSSSHDKETHIMIDADVPSLEVFGSKETSSIVVKEPTIPNVLTSFASMHGPAMRINHRVHAKTVLFCLPFSSLITTKQVFTTSPWPQRKALVDSGGHPTVTAETAVALYILYSRFMAETPHTAMARSFPRHPLHPMMWSTHELGTIRESRLYGIVLQKQQKLEEDWVKLSSDILSKTRSLFPEDIFTKERLQWAMITTAMRSVHWHSSVIGGDINQNELVIAPIIANAIHVDNVDISVDADRKKQCVNVSVSKTKNHQSSDNKVFDKGQLFGFNKWTGLEARANVFLAGRYGAAVMDNADEICQISLGDSNDNGKIRRSLNIGLSLKMSRKGINSTDSFRAMRILNMNADDRSAFSLITNQKIKNSWGKNMISLRNEIAAMSSMQVPLLRLMLGLNSTVEEDRAAILHTFYASVNNQEKVKVIQQDWGQGVDAARGPLSPRALIASIVRLGELEVLSAAILDLKKQQRLAWERYAYNEDEAIPGLERNKGVMTLFDNSANVSYFHVENKIKFEDHSSKRVPSSNDICLSIRLCETANGRNNYLDSSFSIVVEYGTGSRRVRLAIPIALPGIAANLRMTVRSDILTAIGAPLRSCFAPPGERIPPALLMTMRLLRVPTDSLVKIDLQRLRKNINVNIDDDAVEPSLNEEFTILGSVVNLFSKFEDDMKVLESRGLLMFALTNYTNTSHDQHQSPTVRDLITCTHSLAKDIENDFWDLSPMPGLTRNGGANIANFPGGGMAIWISASIAILPWFNSTNPISGQVPIYYSDNYQQINETFVWWSPSPLLPASAGGKAYDGFLLYRSKCSENDPEPILVLRNKIQPRALGMRRAVAVTTATELAAYDRSQTLSEGSPSLSSRNDLRAAAIGLQWIQSIFKSYNSTLLSDLQAVHLCHKRNKDEILIKRLLSGAATTISSLELETAVTEYTSEGMFWHMEIAESDDDSKQSNADAVELQVWYGSIDTTMISITVTHSARYVCDRLTALQQKSSTGTLALDSSSLTLSLIPSNNQMMNDIVEFGRLMFEASEKSTVSELRTLDWISSKLSQLAQTYFKVFGSVSDDSKITINSLRLLDEARLRMKAASENDAELDLMRRSTPFRTEKFDVDMANWDYTRAKIRLLERRTLLCGIAIIANARDALLAASSSSDVSNDMFGSISGSVPVDLQLHSNSRGKYYLSMKIGDTRHISIAVHGIANRIDKFLSRLSTVKNVNLGRGRLLCISRNSVCPMLDELAVIAVMSQDEYDKYNTRVHDCSDMVAGKCGANGEWSTNSQLAARRWLGTLFRNWLAIFTGNDDVDHFHAVGCASGNKMHTFETSIVNAYVSHCQSMVGELNEEFSDFLIEESSEDFTNGAPEILTKKSSESSKEESFEKSTEKSSETLSKESSETFADGLNEDKHQESKSIVKQTLSALADSDLHVLFPSNLETTQEVVEIAIELRDSLLAIHYGAQQVTQRSGFTLSNNSQLWREMQLLARETIGQPNSDWFVPSPDLNTYHFKLTPTYFPPQLWTLGRIINLSSEDYESVLRRGGMPLSSLSSVMHPDDVVSVQNELKTSEWFEKVWSTIERHRVARSADVVPPPASATHSIETSMLPCLASGSNAFKSRFMHYYPSPRISRQNGAYQYSDGGSSVIFLSESVTFSISPNYITKDGVFIAWGENSKMSTFIRDIGERDKLLWQRKAYIIARLSQGMDGKPSVWVEFLLLPIEIPAPLLQLTQLLVMNEEEVAMVESALSTDGDVASSVSAAFAKMGAKVVWKGRLLLGKILNKMLSEYSEPVSSMLSRVDLCVLRRNGAISDILILLESLRLVSNM